MVLSRWLFPVGRKSLITTLCEWLQNSPAHLGCYNHPTDSFSSSSFVKGLYFLSSHESTFFSWLLIVFPITTAPRNYYSERLFKVLFFSSWVLNLVSVYTQFPVHGDGLIDPNCHIKRSISHILSSRLIQFTFLTSPLISILVWITHIILFFLFNKTLIFTFFWAHLQYGIFSS